MSAPLHHNDLEDEILEMDPPDRAISSVSNKLHGLSSGSQLSSDKILKMQETIASLKSELQGVVVKVEQNVGIFKGKITSKIALVLNLLKKKQTHIQSTLDNCFNIIDNLIETFLNVGHELEKDIVVISLKVNDFDNELKNMISGSSRKNKDDTLWFINDEGRLTKRSNSILSPTLPLFKCGDKKVRKSFVVYLNEVFSKFQVPKDQWVKLASNQLIGMARDWWNMHDKEMSWSQFTKSFVDWSFNDNCTRMTLQPTQKQDENYFENADHTEAIKNTYTKQQPPNADVFYSQQPFNNNHYGQRINDNRMNSLTRTSISIHNMDDKKDVIKLKSNYSVHSFSSEESECEASSTSEEKPIKRKYSIYTASNNNPILKKRKVFKVNNQGEMKNNSSFINGRYKLRKRK